MTREEIVTALRYCASNGANSCVYCKECPADGEDCETIVQFSAADLIENQHREIEALKEKLQGAKNTAEQYAAINETLFDSNQKLGADRKALINELCQYCGKYKRAHEGACDGCRWRDK